jgi:hypothetical protein
MKNMKIFRVIVNESFEMWPRVHRKLVTNVWEEPATFIFRRSQKKVSCVWNDDLMTASCEMWRCVERKLVTNVWEKPATFIFRKSQKKILCVWNDGFIKGQHTPGEWHSKWRAVVVVWSRQSHRLRLAVRSRQSHRLRLVVRSRQSHRLRLVVRSRQSHRLRLAVRSRQSHRLRLAVRSRQSWVKNIGKTAKTNKWEKLKCDTRNGYSLNGLWGSRTYCVCWPRP